MEDQELSRLIRRDPEAGWAVLVRQYAGLMVHIIRGRIPGGRADVEEIAADVFAEAFQKWAAYDPAKGSIKAFLATVAVRRAIDWVRRYKEEASLDEAMAGPEDETLLDGLIRAEDKQRVLQVLSELDEPERGMIIGRFFLGRSSREMALVYNLTPNAIDKRISRAIAGMRPKMEVTLDES